MRTCIVCEVEKDVLEFYEMSDGNEHFQPVCKRCRYDYWAVFSTYHLPEKF